MSTRTSSIAYLVVFRFVQEFKEFEQTDFILIEVIGLSSSW